MSDAGGKPIWSSDDPGVRQFFDGAAWDPEGIEILKQRNQYPVHEVTPILVWDDKTQKIKLNDAWKDDDDQPL